MTNETMLSSIIARDIDNLLAGAHKYDREIFRRMRSLGYSSREACKVAIFHSKLGKGEFRCRQEISDWLDDVEETIGMSEAKALMLPGFPYRSQTTYHPLQEEKSNPSYYWN